MPDVPAGPAVLHDPRAQAVLARLHAQDRGQFRSLVAHYLPRAALARLRGRRDVDLDADFLRDKLVAIDPDKGAFCHAQCRALNARRVVEVGTSFGVSTIYLAAAMRDNAGALGEPCVVIGTEIEPQKAAAAQRHLAQAGVEGFAQVRVGDALQTLRDVGGPVDFVLIDTWIPLARPALERLMPQLRPGAVVLCDNITQFAGQYGPYLELVRTRANGFTSVTLPYRGGFEFSVWQPGARPN